MPAIMDPDTLSDIARRAAGRPRDEAFQFVVDECARTWPGHIETRQEWLFNLAGGAVGMMSLLHASMSEYLILFGTSVGTEAFSGRYQLDIYDWVLTGEMWTYTEEDFAERKVTRPGEGASLKKGQAKGFRLAEDTWLLEYGRGPIPTALPMALGDAVFSGMDPRTVVKTLAIYARLVTRELLKGKI